MAISAYILKIVEKDTFLRLQMKAKETFIWFSENTIPQMFNQYTSFHSWCSQQ